jgi:type VI protein secretion system component Hcp
MAKLALDGFLELLQKNGTAAVKGETTDAKFRGKGMKLVSFELKAQQDLSSERSSDPEDSKLFTFSVTKELDYATPDLFKAYCLFWDDHKITWDKARVTLRKAAGGQAVEYLVFEFQDVYVKDWSLDGKDGEDMPEEDVEFCFRTLQFNYWPQTHGGGLGTLQEGGWDFTGHKPLQGK